MKRIFKDGFPHHVYLRGLNGNIIFYTTLDCVYYVTLYSVLSRRYGIRTYSFSLMPNHTHSFQEALTREVFVTFNYETAKEFAKGYNAWHGRDGALFDSPFGSAPKKVGKQIRSCFSYINNNAPVGRLSDHILDYKWNLMAYGKDQWPYSSKMLRDKASAGLRRSLGLVDHNFKKGRPMGYEIQNTIFEGLEPVEKKQLLDYILSRYNFLDYSGLDKYFGSFDKAMLAMEANGGSEYVIQEDWDDYSVYSELSVIVRKAGFCLEHINFDSMLPDDKIMLANEMLTHSRASRRQIEKYLHIAPGG